MDQMRLAGLLLLLLFAALILLFSSWARQNRVPSLRPIPAFEALKTLLARSVEVGRALHFSLGTGGIANQTTADTLAGLTMLDYVAEQTVAAGGAPIVTMADPTVMLLAQERLRQAHQPDYAGTAHPARQVRWLSTQPAAYAAGVMGIISVEQLEGNVMLGRFSDEYLLMGEMANQQKPPLTTIAGASDPNVLPYIYATSPQGLWGEEIFAAGAYLSEKPTHIGSLLAQDTIRWILGGLILVSVVLKLLGVLG
jgi:hypothetical protein